MGQVGGRGPLSTGFPGEGSPAIRTEHVEDGAPAPVEAVLAEQPGQRQCDHVPDLAA